MGLVFANTADFPKMSVPASVFHVYDKLHLDRIPRRYTVEPGKQLEGRWDAAADGSKYDLWVMGHNGFLRHFAGDLAWRARRSWMPKSASATTSPTAMSTPSS